MNPDPGRRLVRWGVVLLFVAAASGFLIPVATLPWLALAGHVQAVLNGLLLVAIGLVWPRLRVGRTAGAITFWGLAGAAWLAFATQVACALAGVGGSVFPLVAGGHVGPHAVELLVRVAASLASVATLAGLGIVAFWACWKEAPRP